MNNLDPEVAENPKELVVYGGIGRAARNWECFDAIVAALRELERRRVAADPVGQAGRRVQDARRRAARADRQLQPRAEVGDVGALQRARPQGPHDVRPDDGRLVDLHRQPGHRAGHLRDVRRSGPPALRRRARRQVDPDRGTRRHGRRAAAGGDDGRRVDARDRMPARRASRCASRRAISTGRRSDLDDALAIIDDACARASAGVASAFSATRRRSCRSSCGAACGRDMVTDQTSAHDLVYGYLPAGWTVERWRAAQADPAQHAALVARGEAVDRGARRGDARVPRAGRPDVRLRQQHPAGRARRRRGRRVRVSGLRARVHPAAVLRRQGTVPLGRAVRRSGGHLQDRSQGEGALSRTTRTCIAGSTWRGSASRSRACPRASAGSGLGERHLAGPRVQRDGGDRRTEGADRHRPRSSRHRLASRAPTARPKRWPTAPTRCPTGRCSMRCSTPPAARRGCRSITAAASAWAIRSTRAWSSSATARKRRRSASSACCGTIPATGVMRHADAGYAKAIEVAQAKGLKLPMLPR